MGSTGPLVALTLSLICFLFSLAGLITGCYSTAWWVISGTKFKSEIGLWRWCTARTVGQKVCTDRDTLFDFKGPMQSSAKDIIMISLIAAAVFCFLAFLSSLLMYWYQRKCDSWRCAALVAFSLGLIGTLSVFGGLGYAEYTFADDWKSVDHGYAVILAWIGAVSQLVAASLCGALVCVVPTQDNGKNQVHYVGNTNPTYQPDFR